MVLLNCHITMFTLLYFFLFCSEKLKDIFLLTDHTQNVPGHYTALFLLPNWMSTARDPDRNAHRAE